MASLSVQDLIKFTQDHQAEIDLIYMSQCERGLVSVNVDDIEGKPSLRLVFNQNAPEVDPEIKKLTVGGNPVSVERQVTVEMAQAFGKEHGEECDRLIAKYRDQGLDAVHLEGHETRGKLTLLFVFNAGAAIDPALPKTEIGGNPVAARHKGEGIKRSSF